MSGTTGNSTHGWAEVISGTGVEEGADLGQHWESTSWLDGDLENVLDEDLDGDLDRVSVCVGGRGGDLLLGLRGGSFLRRCRLCGSRSGNRLQCASERWRPVSSSALPVFGRRSESEKQRRVWGRSGRRRGGGDQGGGRCG
jgi:hypothetical protein